MSNTEKKMHYFLIAANVLFTDKSKGIATAMPVNSMIVSDRRDFNRAMLARANQTAQVSFQQSLPAEANEHVNIVGVQLANIIYLGEMTQTDFDKTPEGLGLAVEG